MLALMRDEATYGVQLLRELEETEALATGQGTVYPLLSRLRREELVVTTWRESTSGPPRRYYELSEAGHAALGARWATRAPSPRPPSRSSAHPRPPRPGRRRSPARLPLALLVVGDVLPYLGGIALTWISFAVRVSPVPHHGSAAEPVARWTLVAVVFLLTPAGAGLLWRNRRRA